MRAALYARVSTHRQDTALQLEELRQYCARRGWEVAGVYQDRESGARTDRPELDRLLQDARRRRFDVLVVWKLDRLSRSLRHLLEVVDTLQSLGVGFVSLTNDLDTTTPGGRLVFHVLGAVAEFERDLIRERVTAGVARAKARGKRLWRPRAKVDVEGARRLRSQGLSLREVAAAMGLGYGTVRAAMKSTR